MTPADRPKAGDRLRSIALSTIRSVCNAYQGSDPFDLQRKLEDSYPFPKRSGAYWAAWKASVKEVLG